MDIFIGVLVGGLVAGGFVSLLLLRRPQQPDPGPDLAEELNRLAEEQRRTNGEMLSRLLVKLGATEAAAKQAVANPVTATASTASARRLPLPPSAALVSESSAACSATGSRSRLSRASFSSCICRTAELSILSTSSRSSSCRMRSFGRRIRQTFTSSSARSKGTIRSKQPLACARCDGTRGGGFSSTANRSKFGASVIITILVHSEQPSTLAPSSDSWRC